MTGSVAVGATQPEDEADPVTAASCRKISRLMGSAGRLSNDRAKRAT